MWEKLSEMMDEVPTMPAWIEAQIQQAKETGAIDWMNAIGKPALEIYNLHQKAGNGDEKAAYALAMLFERGDVPGGPSLDDALTWYEFAAFMGVTRAAYRASQLQSLKNPKNPDAGKDMALLALRNIASEGRSFNWRSAEDWNLAAIVVLHGLEKGIIKEGDESLDKLMAMEGFCQHPDFDRIRRRVWQLSARYKQSDIHLVVIDKRIPEDGDFKARAYRQLEESLPVVKVPSDVKAIQLALDQEFPWFADINAIVYRQLAAAQYGKNPGFKLRPLLLAGLPGVGKTTWAKRLAELCHIPFRTVMAAGNQDSMFLRGTPRGWSSARPGAVLECMVSEGVANPMFLVDELEKASPDSTNGRLWDVMLQLLEPSSAKTYLDECLQVPADLSWVSWIATVNELGNIPKPLLERFTIVKADSPGEQHFLTIIDGAVGHFAAELGIDRRLLPELSGDQMDVLQQCKSPREISRTVQLMLEQGLVDSRPVYIN